MMERGTFSNGKAGGPPTLTKHAVERYIERVKPLATFDEAKRELAVLAAQAEPVKELPWGETHQGEVGFVFLVVSDGIALAVKNGTAVTLMTRGGMGESYRDRRRRSKRSRRTAARKSSSRPVKSGRRPQVEEEYDLADFAGADLADLALDRET